MYANNLFKPIAKCANILNVSERNTDNNKIKKQKIGCCLNYLFTHPRNIMLEKIKLNW